ncbi:MAG: DUF5110 domain-containing protein, partial [Bacteroidaceae bacterium]|nr:DUF5110 domain-containing protein [Bacteroidaceae bacterium]
MYGNDILVAPIYKPAQNGYSTRNVWLPEGTWWDVTEQKSIPGDRMFSARFTQDQFPVYYKAGSVIPLYTVNNSTRTVERTPSIIQLKVAPGADGTGRFYEDAGNNQDYRGDKWAETTFSQTYGTETTTLTISGRKGQFNGMPTTRTWNIYFLGTKPKAVYVNDKETTDYTYTATNNELVVRVTPEDLTQSIVIRVDREDTDTGTTMPDDMDWDSNGETVSVQMPETDQMGVLDVYDLSGKKVAEARATGTRSLSVSLTGMKPGTYVCRFTCGMNMITKKIKK